MADIKRFTVSPVPLAALQGMLSTHGLVADLTKPGEAKDAGFDVSWTYPEPATIEITLIQHPFLEASAFWSVIETALGKPI